jgi:hypothetical protein
MSRRTEEENPFLLNYGEDHKKELGKNESKE